MTQALVDRLPPELLSHVFEATLILPGPIYRGEHHEPMSIFLNHFEMIDDFAPLVCKPAFPLFVQLLMCRRDHSVFHKSAPTGDQWRSERLPYGG